MLAEQIPFFPINALLIKLSGIIIPPKPPNVAIQSVDDAFWKLETTHYIRGKRLGLFWIITNFPTFDRAWSLQLFTFL